MTIWICFIKINTDLVKKEGAVFDPCVSNETWIEVSNM